MKRAKKKPSGKESLAKRRSSSKAAPGMQKAATKKSKEKKPVPFRQWLISGLRKISQRWPPYYGALNRVTRYVDVYDVQLDEDGTYSCACEDGTGFSANYPPKLGRRKLLQCEECHKEFLVKDRYKLKNGKTKMLKTVAVDHVNPIIGDEGFVDWNRYIAGMFPEETEGAFRCLCRECHAVKTAEETAARAATRKKKKSGR